MLQVMKRMLLTIMPFQELHQVKRFLHIVVGLLCVEFCIILFFYEKPELSG